MSIDFNPAHTFAYALAAIGDLTKRRTMNTTDFTNYTELANRFREGLSLSADELQELLRHAIKNYNYLLSEQVTGAMQDAGLNEKIVEEISRAHRPGPLSNLINSEGCVNIDALAHTVDSPSTKEREFHRNQPPYDAGEES